MLNLKNILIPIDFSANSKNALLYSVELAEKFNSSLHLLYIIEPVVYAPDFSMGQITVPAVETYEVEKRAMDELEKISKQYIPESIVCTFAVKIGKPFSEIVDAAKEQNIDLIVISSHGHSTVEHIFFGSTSEKVVKKAPCPVLTLREPLKGFDYKEALVR